MAVSTYLTFLQNQEFTEMARGRTARRRANSGHTSSSASTSPERGADDDADSFYLQPNDSQSSFAPSITEEDSAAFRREVEERCRVSPISRLPAELMIQIFAKLSSPGDLKNCMLASKDWARNSVGLLWHRPTTSNWHSLQVVVQSVRNRRAFFEYNTMVKRLNLSALGTQTREGAIEVSDGTLQPFQKCKRIERLTLTGCCKLTDLSVAKMIDGNKSLLALDVTGLDSITDRTMMAVANNCGRLQGLNITNCRKLTDESLEAVANTCRHLKRLKFNGCTQLTDKSIIAFARNCHQVLEVDLHDCRLLEDDAVTALISEMQHLRELRLAHCSLLSDYAFLNLPHDAIFEGLRILDLTDCGELKDAGVQKIVTAAPRLRNLVLAKCRQITDRAVMAITRLGKNLHYIHLGHCGRITDAGVLQLVKLCNRIRYIDLACCQQLTDTSVQQLATLPKLKRIGLVKCHNITDHSILALAKPKPGYHGGMVAPSSLERVHLSYCTNISLAGITALLNNCRRLTHLSLTGVQAFFNREDLIVFCREAPPDFNEHQRNVFCVFSGIGVDRLRNYLNNEARLAAAAAEDEFDDSEVVGQGMWTNEQPMAVDGGEETANLPPAPPQHSTPFLVHPNDGNGAIIVNFDEHGHATVMDTDGGVELPLEGHGSAHAQPQVQHHHQGTAQPLTPPDMIPIVPEGDDADEDFGEDSGLLGGDE